MPIFTPQVLEEVTYHKSNSYKNRYTKTNKLEYRKNYKDLAKTN